MRPAIPGEILSVQYLPNADPALCRALGVQGGWRCLGLLSTDSDDATYIALDDATKASTVQVSYARSLYAGAANAATPLAGEVIGILSGPTPSEVRSLSLIHILIGAGCHSTQLSGSTVFARDVTFPLQNLPVIALTDQEQALSLIHI